MMNSSLSFPVIDPELFRYGPVVIEIYSVAYFCALISVWTSARYLLKHDRYWYGTPRPEPASMNLLMIYVLVGSLIGGRLGHVLQFPGEFWANPQDIPAIWKGGNSLHGAGIGACFATLFCAMRNGYSSLTAADVAAPGVALGIVFGRLANFVRGELWGRPSDLPWAVVFPLAGPEPRHPSQLYEATLEGLAVCALVLLAIAAGGLKRPRALCRCLRHWLRRRSLLLRTVPRTGGGRLRATFRLDGGHGDEFGRNRLGRGDGRARVHATISGPADTARPDVPGPQTAGYSTGQSARQA